MPGCGNNDEKTMIFAATLVDDENRGVFVTPLSEKTKEECDLFVGLYEEQSDTACGVMAIAAVPEDEDGKVSLSAREVIIDDAYKSPEAEETLIRFLQEMAEEGECSAVYLSEYIPEENSKERAEFMEDLGFFVDDKKLPLYEFSLSDIRDGKPMTEMGCVNVSDLSNAQWEYFVGEATASGLYIMERDYYDAKTSVFLVDDDDVVQAGLLTTIRDEALFIEGIAAYGSDEGSLIEDLVYWATSAAKKKMGKDTTVYLYMFFDRTHNMMLKDFTRGRAKKIGNLTGFTFEVPVMS